jgi:hypothetical protein
LPVHIFVLDFSSFLLFLRTLFCVFTKY